MCGIIGTKFIKIHFEKAITEYKSSEGALLKFYWANQEAEKIRQHHCSYSEVDTARVLQFNILDHFSCPK